jgi:hypothetical protein
VPDILVKLCDLQLDPALAARLAQQQVTVRRVLAPDTPGWVAMIPATGLYSQLRDVTVLPCSSVVSVIW